MGITSGDYYGDKINDSDPIDSIDWGSGMGVISEDYYEEKSTTLTS